MRMSVRTPTETGWALSSGPWLRGEGGDAGQLHPGDLGWQ